MPKTKSSKFKANSKFKFDKTLVAVIAAVVVVTGGYLFYKGTHADSFRTDPQLKGATGIMHSYGCAYNGFGIPATIQRGSTGPCVKALQLALELGTPNATLGPKVDGVFGNTTYVYVLDFQRKTGLTQDAVVGVKTWAKIDNCFNNKVPSTSMGAIAGQWICPKL